MCIVKEQMETVRNFHQDNCRVAKINEMIVLHSALAGECVKRMKAHIDHCAACKAERA